MSREVKPRDMVRGLWNRRAGNTCGLRGETTKAWLRGAHLEERDPEGNAGAGDTWRTFTSLIRVIWETGVIPQQMMWMVVVLLPKGGGDYQGIGLLDPMWKVIEVVMDNRLKCLEYHDCLHGFLAGRGTGMAAMEVKLTQ